MIILVKIEIDFLYVKSLKERRKILNSIKDKLKNKNLSILDLSSDFVKEGLIEICFLVVSYEEKNRKIDFIESVFDNFYGEIEYRISIDEF